jgi:hypothetical protein
MEQRDVALILGESLSTDFDHGPHLRSGLPTKRGVWPSKGIGLQSMEHRHESRRGARVVVTINGRDKSGQPFSQDAVASSLSDSGALLSGITNHVRAGDLVWVEHRGTRSRFKVVWVRDSDSHELIQVAIHRLRTEPCPWAKV